jgi:4,5-dihydroxyphthalate decarboxylase
MSDLKLSFAMTPYDRVLPLINGEVKPDGITLEYQGMPGGVSRVFYDQMKFKRYDVSEMSMSSFLRMRSIRWPYRMLPVFHNRNFSYTSIQIRKGSQIKQNHPEDLKGKRVGIWDYQQSLGLWTRGILQMEWNVKPEDMVWYQERGEHFSHTGVSAEAGLQIPKSVQLNYSLVDFNTMLNNNALDATFGLSPGSGISHGSGLDRVQAESTELSELINLFSDPRKESIRFFKKTGVYPPHHTTVIRESILDEYPWVALSLIEAFEESKRIAIRRLYQSPPTLLVFGGFFLKDIADVFGPDPFQYGIKPNAKAIDMIQMFSVKQGLTNHKQPLDEIFPQEVIFMEERFK